MVSRHDGRNGMLAIRLVAPFARDFRLGSIPPVAGFRKLRIDATNS
jgi:hypothetical protein